MAPASLSASGALSGDSSAKAEAEVAGEFGLAGAALVATAEVEAVGAHRLVEVAWPGEAGEAGPSAGRLEG